MSQSQAKRAEAQKKRFAKSILKTIAVANALRRHKAKLSMEWDGLNPTERKIVVRATIGANITGTDFESLLGCVNC